MLLCGLYSLVVGGELNTIYIFLSYRVAGVCAVCLCVRVVYMVCIMCGLCLCYSDTLPP